MPSAASFAQRSHQTAPEAPLVSVCMAVFNAEPFLEASLRSILGQTYPNLEVVLVDDGSADRSYDVAASIADPRLHVSRSSRNLGGYEAMNRAAASARGEFVAFYHADDVYDSTIVAKEIAYLQAHPEVGAVFTLDHNIDEAGRRVATVTWPESLPHGQPFDFATVLRYQLRHRNPFCCPTFLTRRSVFEATGGFDAARWGIVADVDLWLRIARRFPLAILDEPLVSYRKGRHQWTARYRRLRTDRDLYFDVIDQFVASDGRSARLTSEDMTEYKFHSCDDATFCAANLVLTGEIGHAVRRLDEKPFPWRTLRTGLSRRKVRLLALRTLLRTGLAIRAHRPLCAALRRIGP